MTAVDMFRRTITDFTPSSLFDGTLFTLGLARFDIWVVLIAFASVLALEFFQEKGGRVRVSLDERGFFIQWMAILVPMAAILFLSILSGGFVASQFIYGNF